MLKYRSVLSSIISYAPTDKITDITESFTKVYAARLVFPIDTQIKVYQYICDHTLKFTEVPSYSLVCKHFEDDSDITEELEKISKEKPLLGNNLESLLSEVVTDQQKVELNGILRTAAKIADTGHKISKNEFLVGPEEAIKYLNFHSQGVIRKKSLIRNEGSLKGDTYEAVKKYYDIKGNNRFDGLLTGLETIDMSCKGIFPTDFWLIMAFVSELKTTLAQNFAYTQSIEQGKNVKFISLEMSYEECRDIFVAIHSANFNLWAGSEWDDIWPLNHEDIVEGTLNQRQEEFFEFLCDDLDKNPEYGALEIYKPEGDFTIAALKHWADIEYKKRPFDAVYLDYIELMRDEFKTKDYSTDLNQRIKDLRQFTLNFNNGKGMRLISAYQANRKGKEMADKHDGEYRLDSLSYANEAERSTTVIIYSYLNDELRANNEVKIGCLKNRARSKFKQFTAKTRLASRKVYEPPREEGVDSDSLSQKSTSDNTKKLKNQKSVDINDIV